MRLQTAVPVAHFEVTAGDAGVTPEVLALVLGTFAGQRVLSDGEVLERDRVVRAEAVLLAVQFGAFGTLLGRGHSGTILRRFPW